VSFEVRAPAHELAASFERGENVPERWVPNTTYWVVENAEVVGEFNIRHMLTPYLQEVGGHIGYGTHPLHRRKGVATYALQQALKRAAGMGIGEALVTCRDDNAGSIRVIEKCGGMRLSDSTTHGVLRRRYVFRLTSHSYRSALPGSIDAAR
jgi:predicted acetyltransferase